MHPGSTIIANDGVKINNLTRSSTWVFSRGKCWALVYISNHHISLFKVWPKPFTFHVIFPCSIRGPQFFRTPALITKLSPYSIGRLRQHSLKRASRTIINNKGLKTNPWWTPTIKSNLSATGLLILMTLAIPVYMTITALVNHSLRPNFLKVLKPTLQAL